MWQRFSFGYPACPELEDQKKLFNLISPEDIGIELTEGFMMEPEESVTAIVFAHPKQEFNVLKIREKEIGEFADFFFFTVTIKLF